PFRPPPPARPALYGFDRPIPQAGDPPPPRRHLPEPPPHRRHLRRAGGGRDGAAQAEQEAHLRPVAYVRLVVAVAVARRRDVDLAREDRVVVHEHALPRHLHVLAHHHAVGLVIAPRERPIELARRCA